MPRTHGRIKVEVWEAGSDWRLLALDAQWAYQMLLSQPEINMCGVLPYRPKKWAKFAQDLSLERLARAVDELEASMYVIVDRDSDELFIRTFVKHDQAWHNPNLVIAARRQFREIESGQIRSYLAQRHEWLTDPEIEVKKYEEERASEWSSERALRLASGQASL